MTAQPVNHFTDILTKWQSSAMIPVVLQLLNEELNHLEGRYISTLNIQAYQTLYRQWEKDQTLNQKQQSWIREMGGCLDTLKHRIFSPHLNNHSDLKQTEKNSFELKI